MFYLKVCISIFTLMSLKIFASIIFLFVFSFCAPAQQKEFEFKNFTQENGLPSNESYFVFRDSKDFLWIATDQGIVRYNGTKMERFSLPDNVVFKIREDRRGRVWFFSHTGKLAYFFEGAIHAYKYNDRIVKAFKNILILNACVNDDDEIIINSTFEHIKISKSGLIERKYYRYFEDNKTDSNILYINHIRGKEYYVQELKYFHPNSGKAYVNLVDNGRTIQYEVSIIPGVYAQSGCVTENRKDFYLFYGRSLVKLYADGSFKVKNFPSVISSIGIDKNIWLGFMQNGMALLDTALNIIYKDQFLKDKTVTSVRTDHEGGTWFSTLEKGVFYLKNPGIRHLTGDSSLSQPVFRFFAVSPTSLLFGNSDGVHKLSANIISLIDKHYHEKITDIFTDKNRNIIVAGSLGSSPCGFGLYCKSADKNYNNIFLLSSVSEVISSEENKYIFSQYNGIIKFDWNPGFKGAKEAKCLEVASFDTSVINPGFLFLDSRKQIWKGSINSLHKFNKDQSSPVEIKPHDKLFKNGFTCMRQLENGIYTIGARFGGIVLMQDTSVIARITENEGLLSNSIKYLLPLKDKLWAATAKGISVISFQSYDPVKYTITNIGKNDGFDNLIIYQLMLYQGKMLVATSNGIYEIDQPEQIPQRVHKPIPFYINSVSYYKGDTSGISTITLPYNKNRIIIKYSAVCFNLTEEVKYYYRFDNRDTTWYEIASTELVMENLIPGNYNLEIKAVIPGEQRFSDVQKLQIVVEKPWWQNSWLIIAGLFIIAVIVYRVYKNRIKKITAREQEKTALKSKMIEMEQTALRAQMNPHFIFNCLTSIQQLVVTGNKTEANEYLVRFARLIRKTLELSGRSFITIEEETNYLNEYLILEQLRIPGQFEFYIQTDANIDTLKTEIPNMMLQPIVENSIRHGIKHLDNKKGHVNIMLEQADDHIICTITDNGVGRKKLKEANGDYFNENKSLGMDIVNRRLEALSFHPANETMLKVEDLYDPAGLPMGTKVTMRLPFKTR